MIKLVDQWTTQDGEWYPSGKPYSIKAGAWHQWHEEPIPGKGGATHIFVKGRVGDKVRFYTEGGLSDERIITDQSGWVNMPMWRSSAYMAGEGPWHVEVNGVKVNSRGIGLPQGNHVSTFLVTEHVEDDAPAEPQPIPPAPAGQYVEFVVRTMVDGLQIGEQVVWRSQ